MIDYDLVSKATTFITLLFPKLPSLTALSLLSHLPLIKHLPDPFLLLCGQYNSFHSCLLNEMGKHTYIHTHSLGVCVEREISSVFRDERMQVAGMHSIYIHTQCIPQHILHRNMPCFGAQTCHVCRFDGVWVLLTV